LSGEALVADMNRGFDALEAGDLDGFMATVERIADPEVEFVSAIGSSFGGSSYKGQDGIRSWFGDLLDTSSKVTYSQREFRVLDDEAVLFLAQFTIEGRSSGAVVESEVGTVFELKEGHAHRIVSYTSHEEATAVAEALDA
jgi:ketosteroid isomerase-like protein